MITPIPGNPNLKPYNKHEWKLTYFLNKASFLFTTEASVTYAKKPILPFFQADKDYLVETLDNLNSNQYLHWDVYMQWFPFASKTMRFVLYAELFRSSNSFSDITWNYNGYRVQPMIIANYQRWNLRAFYLSKSKTLIGQRLQASPSVAAIELSYKPIDRLTATLAVRYPFYRSWTTYSETHPSALVHKYESESVKEMANMISVGLVYNFSFGKTISEVKRKVNNTDKDSGVLNRIK
jgi:outer membrane receptor protein involved in Fe transport